MVSNNKGHHEPRNKRDAGVAMCPGWVHSTMSKLLNQLDGRHDAAMVAAVALMGPDGFDFKTTEESINFDPSEYGLIMLEGYTMIAGGALAKMLDTVYASTQAETHFTHDIDDNEEKLQQLRNLYEQAIRQFLQGVIRYAGAEFQHGKTHDLSVAAGSQMLNLWNRVATSTVKFVQSKENPDEADDESGDGAEAG